MSFFNRRLFVSLMVFFVLLLPLSGSAKGEYFMVSAGSPSIITKPDYYDPYLTPSPKTSAFPGQFLLSPEGYIFTLHEGKRYYPMVHSYGLMASEGATTILFAAPMIIVNPEVTTFAAPSTAPATTQPMYYYLVSP